MPGFREAVEAKDSAAMEALLAENGRDHALIFTAKVGDVSINGCDFLRYNESGLIEDFMVMVRPLSAANALSEAMGAQFEQILAEAT